VTAAPFTGISLRSPRGLAFYVFVLAMAALGVGAWLESALVLPPVGLGPVVGLAMAFLVARLLTTRLPQGDEVCVTLVVGLYALTVLDIRSVILASAAASLLDVVARLSQSTWLESEARLVDAVRGAAVLALVSPWQLLLQHDPAGAVADDAIIGWALLAGASLVVCDVVTVSIQQWILGGLPVRQGIAALLRPLGTAYLVHLAMAAVAIRLSATSGTWAFPIALLLTLILQNSFNLYLRIRRAYAETIGALAHAAELDRPYDSGHARRVADLSVAVGRRMGLASGDLERIGYAALLHDIGYIGDLGDASSDAHLRRGADIVASIPFLAGVASLIDSDYCQTDPGSSSGAAIVRLCSRYDRLRAQVGSTRALELLFEEQGDPGSERAAVTSLTRGILEEIVGMQSTRACVGR